MRQGRLRLDSRFAWAALMLAETSASGWGRALPDRNFWKGRDGGPGGLKPFMGLCGAP
jgi:hypothetical protein